MGGHQPDTGLVWPGLLYTKKVSKKPPHIPILKRRARPILEPPADELLRVRFGEIRTLPQSSYGLFETVGIKGAAAYEVDHSMAWSPSDSLKHIGEAVLLPSNLRMFSQYVEQFFLDAAQCRAIISVRSYLKESVEEPRFGASKEAPRVDLD